MGKLIYSLNVSLDGYVETPDRSLAWATVDEELHSWFNDQVRRLDASIYGRRMYELMAAYWPNAEADPAATPAMRDFARIWNAMPKVNVRPEGPGNGASPHRRPRRNDRQSTTTAAPGRIPRTR